MVTNMEPPLWAEKRDRRLTTGIRQMKTTEIASGVPEFGNTSYPYGKERKDIRESIRQKDMIIGITPQIFKYENPSRDVGFKKVEPLSEYATSAYMVWGAIISRVVNTVEYIAKQEHSKSPQHLTDVEFRLYIPRFRFNIERFLKTASRRL